MLIYIYIYIYVTIACEYYYYDDIHGTFLNIYGIPLTYMDIM